MSRRLSTDSGEIEPGTPLRFASPFLVSHFKASTLLEESGSEKSDGTELALLGDNTCSRSPAKGGVKIEIPKAEADTYFVWSSNNPPPDFETIAAARGKIYCTSLLKEPPSSTTLPPIHRGSVVAKAEDWFASEDSQPSIPKSQEDNIQDNSIHNDGVHGNETSIVEVIRALLLTFSTVVKGTSRLAFFSILVPLSFVKRTGLLVLCALFEVAKLWLLFASQCYNTLLLITKKLTLRARIQCIKGLTWALQLLIWSKKSKAALRRDEGPAGHFTDQPKEKGCHQL
ncbi:hypothetical protein N0V85_000814 [Neurospora sp. IMI 360204]|nr:hypothetical protein N0V85_000814 [Neurospora sp. IMI 360204]